MKKFIITILAIFYLGASSGATVHLHFCMGKLINWSLSHDIVKKCSNCGMENGDTKNCCKDQHYKLKVKDSTQASAIVYHFNTLVVDVPLIDKEPDEVFVNSLDKNEVFSNSPPRTQATPAFIRNCSFRI